MGSAQKNPLVRLDLDQWTEPLAPASAAHATGELERGRILFLPNLAFPLAADELRFLAPNWGDAGAKNISYDPSSARIRHTSALGRDREHVTSMMARFAECARSLVLNTCPAYAGDLRYGLTSFRPVQIRTRQTTRNKDDTRVHIDAFVSRPVHGRRILRVFCNINPHGEARVWEVGEPFEDVVTRFRGRIAPQVPGSAWLLQAVGITKTRRSAYDHIMLGLHDIAKRDDAYQSSTVKTRLEFPAHSTWIAFTDRVMHAAVAGQHVLEQTFYLPVPAMQNGQLAPLRVLEKMYGRTLT